MRVNLRKAILLAPLSQIAITAIAAVFFGVLESSNLKEILVSWVALSVFSTPIAYIATIVIGLPVHLWLERRNLSTVRNHAIAGVSFGLAGAMTLILPHATLNYVSFSAVVFLSSLIVAMTFGVLTVSRTPSGNAI